MQKEDRKKEVFKIVTSKLIDNNLSFNYKDNFLNVDDYFKICIYSNNEIEIITNNYRKDFKFLSNVSDAFILGIIDKIIFNY